MPPADDARCSMAVQQFVPFLHPRDAVGNHALAIDRTVRSAGAPTNLWVAHVEAQLARFTRPYRRYRGSNGSGPSADVLLYQASTGAPEMVQFLLERREPLAIYYHNFTPPTFFEIYDAAAAQSMREAAQDIQRLAGRCAVALVASEFSASELRALGFDDIRLMPPYLAGASEVPPDPDYLRSLRTTHAQLDLLFVGRLVPHKGHLNLLRMLAALRAGGIDARIFMVGAPGPHAFMEAFYRLRRRLALEPTAVVTGSVTEAELAAHYESADLYVSLSEHEGFGLPILEAMRAGLPVIAYGAGAVGEVLGNSGVLLGTLDPYLVAEVVARVGLASDLASALARRERERALAIDESPRDAILLNTLYELAAKPA